MGTCGKADSSGSDPVAQTISAYEKNAESYPAIWFQDPAIKPMLDRFLSLLEESREEPRDVLDVGCGLGRDVLAIAESGIETVGIDLCDAMVTLAREKAPECIFRRMDMRSLKYPPETFAGIWSCASLNHLPLNNATTALTEFARVLKPEGMIGVTIKEGQGECFDALGRYWHLHAAADFCQLIVESGFQIIERSSFWSEKEALVKGESNKWLHILARKSSTFSDTLESDCVLCPTSRFQLHREIGFPGPGSILWRNSDLYVIPDIAPLMEGHLLMVTTPHYMCFGACPDTLEPEIYSMQQRIRQLFRSAYQEATLFLEHGPARLREAGSCIDHAHWHCLPASFRIKERVDQLIGPGQVASIDMLRSLYETGQSYLYIEENTEEKWVYLVDVVPGQFLRQVVASTLGHTDWRWQSICKTPENYQIYNRMLGHLLPLVDRLWT